MIRHIDYKPPGPVSAAFMRSEHFVRGIMGPFGSGKSTACIMEIWRRAVLQKPGLDGIRRTRWVIVRNTFPELKTTTIKSWHQWFPPEMGKWKDSGPPTHIIESGDIWLEVIFLALDRPDDISKLLSLEVTGAWMNEAREMPKAVLDGLTGRVGRFPSKLMGGCTWSGVIMDTNPPDTDHWWYKLAEEEKPKDFGFFKQPSGISAAAENRENLPALYYERMMAGKKPEWIKIYIHGDYGFSMDGKPVHPDYNDQIHCKELKYNPMLGIHIGLDFGLTPAAVIGQCMPMGQVRQLSEVVAKDMGAKNFARVLKAHIGERYGARPRIVSITGDPAGDGRKDTDEETVFQVLKAEGIFASPAYTNDPTIRIGAVDELLQQNIDGIPRYQLDPFGCPTLRKAKMGGYQYKRMQLTGEERFRDVPDKNHFSHVSDAEQYEVIGMGHGRALTMLPENINIQQVDIENSFHGT